MINSSALGAWGFSETVPSPITQHTLSNYWGQHCGSGAGPFLISVLVVECRDCWLFSSQAVVRVDPTQGTAEEVELPGMTRALAFDGTGRWRARAVEPKVLVLEDQVTGAEVRRWETTGWIEPPLAFAEGSLWALVDSVLRRFDLP